MSYAYAVVGAGRQGIAAAYDLVMLGDASRLLFVDANEDAAHAAAATMSQTDGSAEDGRVVENIATQEASGGGMPPE